MNYIKQLQADNVDLKARIRNAHTAVSDFKKFLQSPKFTGVESDGGRKDWISTQDVFNWLSNITDDLNGVA